MTLMTHEDNQDLLVKVMLCSCKYQQIKKWSCPDPFPVYHETILCESFEKRWLLCCMVVMSVLYIKPSDEIFCVRLDVKS